MIQAYFYDTDADRSKKKVLRYIIARDISGHTPLELAIINGRVDCIDIFYEHGYPVGLTNSQSGKNAMSCVFLAREVSWPILEILMKNGEGFRNTKTPGFRKKGDVFYGVSNKEKLCCAIVHEMPVFAVLCFIVTAPEMIDEKFLEKNQEFLRVNNSKISSEIKSQGFQEEFAQIYDCFKSQSEITIQVFQTLKGCATPFLRDTLPKTKIMISHCIECHVSNNIDSLSH